MSRREAFEFEVNRSDPEDSDYDNTAPSRPAKRKAARPSGTHRAPKRRRRDVYGGSDVDDDDVDDFGEDLSFSDKSSIDSATIERTQAGRPKRSTTKKAQAIIETSDAEEELDPIESDGSLLAPQRKPKQRDKSASSEAVQPSLIVKLKAFYDPQQQKMVPQRRSTRQRTSSKSIEPRGAIRGTRRSSRQSEGEDLIELTTSGKHAQSARKSATPEPMSAASARGLRATKRMPTNSTIIEASQEDSPGPADQSEGEKQEEKPMDEGEGNEDVKGAPVGGESDDNEEPVPLLQSDVFGDDGEAIAESVPSDAHGDDEDEDDEEPIRTTRTRRSTVQNPPELPQRQTRSHGTKKKPSRDEDGSDFEPLEEEDDDGDVNMSGSDDQIRPNTQQSEGSSGERRSTRIAGRKRARNESRVDSEADLDQDELAEEAAELAPRKRRRRQQIVYDEGPVRRPRGEKPDYRIFKPETLQPSDDEAAALPVPRSRRTAGPYRSLLPTLGPFGGAGGPGALLAGPEAAGAVGGADSDSSDDELGRKESRANIGGTVGMTPTSAQAQANNLVPQPLNTDPVQQAGSGGGPANFGKVKDRKALADADPLGVDQTVSFEGVGGLDNHINQLKEMVMLPLLYPELFQQFKVTPPRGVLFHGPPGTGKTLLARALASSVSSQGRKVTFYMRKGADALSKWVGEAERQLRLLFEEARKNQPSIIFFDEIDGLAPVRSSKQEQIHASIVATLLALMDGMDGRGQVIVIGATNRPDSVDPALRRPGRFDREFFFPLPAKLGRKSILDIHTKGWEPPLEPKFKDQLAELTKGYGGADLRALCTEAALNAVQGTYPQIYKSDQKLVIDPTKIRIQPKDFMISIDKMIPSSERSGSSGAAPMEDNIEPLLRKALDQVSELLDDVLPTRPKRTALEEAEYDDRDSASGFDREMMQQNFDKSRVYRPRLLIKGARGMGQQYLGGAILHKYERLHVQSFDLATLFNDATRTPESAVIRLFNEVRRHKPSVIYLPNVNTWYETVGRSVTKLFSSLLRSLPPTEPVLVLGIMELESDNDKPDENMLRELFGFSSKNQYTIERAGEPERRAYFDQIITMIGTPPSALPEAQDRRKKRRLPELEVAPAPAAPVGPSKEDLKAQKKQDMQVLNMLKIHIQPLMDQIRNKYKKFRHPTIDESRIEYLFDEQDPNMLSTDVPEDQRQELRPFELRKDPKGIPGLLETATGKFYYNIEIVTIERRLSNGYYKRYKDFLADIKRLAKDARTSGDDEKTLKANELLANVQVDIGLLEQNNPALVASSEAVYQREKQREAQQQAQAGRHDNSIPQVPKASSKPSDTTATQTTGPITLGEPVPGHEAVPHYQSPVRPPHSETLTNGDTSTSPSARYTSRSNGHLESHSHSHSHSHSQSDGEAEAEADVQMTNSQDPSPPSQHSQPAHLRSQKSAMTPLATGSQPGDYHNSASTTTSGNKNSSGDQNMTQSSNGIKDTSPDFSGLKNLSGQSQLPDTQEMAHSSSQSQGPGLHNGDASQIDTMMPPPARERSSINNLLNSPSTPKLIIDHTQLEHLHDELTRRSSGCSVEQLEQINAALMKAVWRTRGEWNRMVVIRAVMEAFNEVVKDIEEVQRILPGTQSSGSGRTEEDEGALA
ncbi:MAG: hypothetical protein Q9162_000111 [Coniocarpon cinnabarinum]